LQESASDWNSLLLTARAERGPQWDVGTQQCVTRPPPPYTPRLTYPFRFLIEQGTELYYDPTPIRGYLKDERVEAAKAESSGPTTRSRGPPNGSVPQGYGVNGVGVAATPPRHAMSGSMGPPGYGAPPYGGIPPSQFYGTPDRGTPMMTRGMSMEGGINSDMRRRMP
jgi:hypothetical protein